MTVKVLASFAVALVLGCGPAEPAALLDQPGDPCRGDDYRCVGDHEVWRCEDNVIVETDCDDVCAELGPSWIAAGCDRECVCVPADPSGCWPGETACVNEQTLERCSDAQLWEAIDCEQLCAATGLSSVGCAEQTDELTGVATADCWCSGEATPCDPSAPAVCADETTIALCEAGEWVFRDCATICGDSSQCIPWQTPATCAC